MRISSSRREIASSRSERILWFRRRRLSAARSGEEEEEEEEEDFLEGEEGAASAPGRVPAVRVAPGRAPAARTAAAPPSSPFKEIFSSSLPLSLSLSPSSSGPSPSSCPSCTSTAPPGAISRICVAMRSTNQRSWETKTIAPSNSRSASSSASRASRSRWFVGSSRRRRFAPPKTMRASDRRPFSPPESVAIFWKTSSPRKSKSARKSRASPSFMVGSRSITTSSADAFGERSAISWS